MTECLIALAIPLACVSMSAIFLVEEIHSIVLNHGVPDNFMDLIVVPLVEKAAEHFTTIDEAWDNQINLALAHCLSNHPNHPLQCSASRYGRLGSRNGHGPEL